MIRKVWWTTSFQTLVCFGQFVLQHIEWRRQEQLRNCIRNGNPPVGDLVPWTYCGLNESGGPGRTHIKGLILILLVFKLSLMILCLVIVIRYGLWEPPDFYGQRDSLMKSLIYNMETLTKFTCKVNEDKDYLPQMTLIVDCKGVSWRHYFCYDCKFKEWDNRLSNQNCVYPLIALQASVASLQILEAHYPESLGFMVALNGMVGQSQGRSRFMLITTLSLLQLLQSCTCFGNWVNHSCHLELRTNFVFCTERRMRMQMRCLSTWEEKMFQKDMEDYYQNQKKWVNGRSQCQVNGSLHLNDFDLYYSSLQILVKLLNE